MNYLFEDNRYKLISKSKSSLKGRQRFNRRNKSKVANTVKAMNSIDMNKLFKEDILTVDIPVKGETGDYIVKVTFGGFLEILRDQIKDKEQVEFRDISRAAIIGFNKDDVFIHCSCPDFCLHKDTKIKLLNGETFTIDEIYNKFKSKEELWVYSVDSKGDFKPGKVTDVWISGFSNEFIKVILDNGKEVLTTPNHRYMMRDGTYKEARNLNINESLMPLYFNYHNGYENVKLNSVMNKTIYKSIYKSVSSELLNNEIEEAKRRSNENCIQIHHKDFNKLNNYPSNLLPMGKLEHWRYHYNHLYESGNFDKWQEGGKKYWEKESSRLKQSEVMKKTMLEYYSNLTSEEISNMRREAGTYSQEWKDKISISNKNVWNNYNEAEYIKRCNINKVSNNNPITKQKQSERRKQYFINNPEHKIKCKENLLKAQEAVRGKSFSEEHKRKIKESHLNKSIEEKEVINQKRKLTNSLKSKDEIELTKIKGRDSKILNIINFMNSNNIELTFENYRECMKLPQFYRKSYPYIGKYFNTIEEIYNYYNLNDNYNHKIVDIQHIVLDEEIPIYDISVDKYDNFYVDAGVILHNCYRFAYYCTRNQVNSGAPENRPSNITNPHDSLGSACKHVLLVLNNTSWIIKVASVINNYINYMQRHYEKLYADVIYPAIYNKKYEEPVQLDIDNIDNKENTLATDSDTIDAANKFNQDRTRFKKGNTQGVRFASNNKDKDQLEMEENPDDQL